MTPDEFAFMSRTGETFASHAAHRMYDPPADTAEVQRLQKPPADWQPSYSPWRHGGWYVHNVRYPSGAVGCVSRNYADRKWRIVCDDRPDAHEKYTYPNRDAAARAEYALAEAKRREEQKA